MQIKIDALGNTIGKVLSPLTVYQLTFEYLACQLKFDYLNFSQDKLYLTKSKFQTMFNLGQ